MSFLDDIFAQLEAAGDTSVLWELHDRSNRQSELGGNWAGTAQS